MSEPIEENPLLSLQKKGEQIGLNPLAARLSGMAQGTSQSSIKMHILVVCATKEESEKLKSKVFDFRFSKVSAAYPEAKKIARDVHAIVGHYKSEEDFEKVTAILDTFEKYTIKVLTGKKTDGETLA